MNEIELEATIEVLRTLAARLETLRHMEPVEQEFPEQQKRYAHLLEDAYAALCAGYFLRYAAYFYRFYVLYTKYHPLLCLREAFRLGHPFRKSACCAQGRSDCSKMRKSQRAGKRKRSAQ